MYSSTVITRASLVQEQVSAGAYSRKFCFNWIPCFWCRETPANLAVLVSYHTLQILKAKYLGTYE